MSMIPKTDTDTQTHRHTHTYLCMHVHTPQDTKKKGLTLFFLKMQMELIQHFIIKDDVGVF